MSTDTLPPLEECTCLAVRQAARHVTQFYDRHLAPVGLRTTQFSILASLRRHGAMTINALAEEMVMDRTTLGRNILPLERDGLISIKPGRTDRRSKELRLTDAGLERLRAGFQGWKDAQREFAAAFGNERTVGLRALLHEVVGDRPSHGSRCGWLNENCNHRADFAQLQSVGPYRRIYALLGPRQNDMNKGDRDERHRRRTQRDGPDQRADKSAAQVAGVRDAWRRHRVRRGAVRV